MTTAQRPTTALQAYNDFDERGMRKFRWNMNVGREPWGFSLNAEVWNGRIAMLAFFWVLIQEAIVGKGVLEQYGFPFDEGAVLEKSAGFVLPGVIGLVFAVVLTIGLSVAGVKAEKALNPDSELNPKVAELMSKLPF